MSVCFAEFSGLLAEQLCNGMMGVGAFFCRWIISTSDLF
jgi:hypothetical protein